MVCEHVATGRELEMEIAEGEKEDSSEADSYSESGDEEEEGLAESTAEEGKFLTSQVRNHIWWVC